MNPMHNVIKIARWEIKRNLKNKTFLFGLFLTPAIFLGFMLLGAFFTDSDSEDEAIQLFIQDEANILPLIEDTVKESDTSWKIHETEIDESEVATELEDTENTAYLFLNSEKIQKGTIQIYTSEDMPTFFSDQLRLLEGPIQVAKMNELGLSEEQLNSLAQGIQFVEVDANEQTGETEEALGANFLDRLIPGVFGGIIMFSIVMTGMAIFQSASQEKKDKIAEILLSSVTPGELMQGKIIGYFVLGLIQVTVFLIFILPFVVWRFDIPLLSYLLVPETLLFVGLAILSYLLFASIFVGIGATMSDISTAGNFQGFVMMLPFLPFIFIGPVLSDPNGLWAQVGTYIPITSPGVLLIRLIVLEEWPWIEIIIALVILIVSIWIVMKLAGKIFQVGILMYGKNATPKEIWKWIRA